MSPAPVPFLFTWQRAVRDHPTLSSRARLAAFVLATYMDPDGSSCYPSVGKVAEGMAAKPGTARRAIRDLQAAGLLSAQKRGGRYGTNLYEPHLPPSPIPGDTPQERSPVSADHQPYHQRQVTPITRDTQPAQYQNKTNPVSKSRPELFDAVVEACGWESRTLTDKSSAWVDAVVPGLRKAGATPDEILARARIYRANYAGQYPTPTALEKHWPALTPATLERIDQKALNRELAYEAQTARLSAYLEERDRLGPGDKARATRK